MIKEVTELKNLLNYVSPGPWKADFGNMEVEINYPDRRTIASFSVIHGLDTSSDMEFIAKCRSAIPKLIQEIERLSK